jgi:CO dehydrogenase maturation factor
MAGELKLNPGMMGLIVNRAPGGELAPGIKEEISRQGLTLLGVVPQDDTIYDYDSAGKPVADIPEDSRAKAALSLIIDKLGI